MATSLAQIIAEAREGDSVAVSLTTNEDDGIAAYAEGNLRYRPASGGEIVGGPRFRPATLSTTGSSPLSMYFSDRRLAIDPPSAFPAPRRQPFSANATERLGATLFITSDPALTVELFGSKTKFSLASTGNLLVGTGPQFGSSPEAVWVVAFLGVIRNP